MTSHELRNPLSAITLSADSSAERLQELVRTSAGPALGSRMTSAFRATSVHGLEPMPRFQAEVDDTLDLKFVSHCCVHMTRLIDNVLTLSKLDNQFLMITPVKFIWETLQIQGQNAEQVHHF